MNRILNYLLACLFLAASLPCILILAMVVLVTDGPPVFFYQKRVGLKGTYFSLLKFRTMVRDAEEILRQDHRLMQIYVSNNFKVPYEADPRYTEIGSFLRRWSLDELPQIWNVLKGDMNLVGPRPVVPQELRRYNSARHEFLSVKPGITGFWQINGRSNVKYPERKEMDMYYIYNRSTGFDLWIMWQTVFAVLHKRGAY